MREDGLEGRNMSNRLSNNRTVGVCCTKWCYNERVLQQTLFIN